MSDPIREAAQAVVDAAEVVVEHHDLALAEDAYPDGINPDVVAALDRLGQVVVAARAALAEWDRVEGIIERLAATPTPEPDPAPAAWPPPRCTACNGTGNFPGPYPGWASGCTTCHGSGIAPAHPGPNPEGEA